MTTDLDKLEAASFEEDDSNELPPTDIVAYNELRSCADIFRMHKQGILEIQPDFQRDVVWKGTDQTRFIDSLIKQLPIPSMCFAMDFKAQKWIVIDGLQRISAITRFLRGDDWKLSKLDDIEPDISGKSAAAIKTSKTKLNNYYTRVENQSLPINVLRCDFSKKSHMEYLFTIFHRLNAGGIKLNNQEIRNCIYSGEFNLLLHNLDLYPSWRRINKMKEDNVYRFTKQEIMLRFFAFHDRLSKYKGQVGKFLNDYMYEHRNPSEGFLDGKRELLQETSDLIHRKIFEGKAPPKTPVTVLEAILVGVAKNLPHLNDAPQDVVKGYYSALIAHEQFSDKALAEGLAKTQKVKDRINTSIRIFSGG